MQGLKVIFQFKLHLEFEFQHMLGKKIHSFTNILLGVCKNVKLNFRLTYGLKNSVADKYKLQFSINK